MALAEKIRLSQPLRGVKLLRHEARATRSETEARIRQAYEQGMAEGSERVNQQLLDQRREMNEARTGLLLALEKSTVQAVAEVRNALPDLVMEGLRRLLGRVEIKRETVVAIVEEMLAEIGPEVGPVEVRLNPEDWKQIEEREAELARNHPGLRLVADEKLDRGDCQATTRFGKIDARLQNKLEKLRESLTPES